MPNYKFVKRRRSLTSSEITESTDFSALLDAYRTSDHSKFRLIPSRAKLITIVSIAGALLLLITFSVHYFIPEENSNIELKEKEIEIEQAEQIPPTEQRTYVAKEAENPEKEQEEVKNENRTTVTVKEKRFSSEDDHHENNQLEMGEEIVFKEAVPVAGYNDLYKYFHENLVYPEIAVLDSIEGNVTVRFTIDTTGNPINVNIEESLHPDLDSTAISLIQNMPAWKPAILGNRSINSSHLIPVYFKIEKE